MNKNLTMSCVIALSFLGIGCHATVPPRHAQATACQHECPMHQAPGHGEGHACPMHQAAALSDIKVQSTDAGAVIELVAKRPEDASKVQESAQQMAAMLSGGCPMHGAHGAAHHHHHAHPAATQK